MRIITHVIELKICNGDADLPTWNYFKTLLERLDVNGMSSEEDSIQKLGRITTHVYLVKVCEWRAVEVADYLKIIDDMGDEPSFQSNAGSKRFTRIRSGEVGDGVAVQGLPECWYNPQWLETLKVREIDELQISEEAFHLLTVATERL